MKEKQIEDLLVAQVLTLAATLKAAKTSGDTINSSGDYINEAIYLVRQKRDRVLQALSETPS